MINEIHTGFYSDEAEKIISKINHALLHSSSRVGRNTADITQIVRAPNNEIVLTRDTTRWGGRNNIFMKAPNEAQAKIHIAHLFKAYAIGQLNYLGKWHEWKRTNYKQSELEGMSIAQVYLVYDLFHGRKCNSVFSEELKAYRTDFIGTELDPVATEQNMIHKAELEKLKKELSDGKNKLFNERDEKIYALRKAVIAEYDEKVNAFIESINNKITELNQTFEAMKLMMCA